MICLDCAQFQAIAKALADPTRFHILELLARTGEMSCGALVERLPVAQPTISHHLKELALAGLVECRREGQFGYYQARPDVIEAYLTALRRQILPGGHAA